MSWTKRFENFDLSAVRLVRHCILPHISVSDNTSDRQTGAQKCAPGCLSAQHIGRWKTDRKKTKCLQQLNIGYYRRSSEDMIAGTMYSWQSLHNSHHSALPSAVNESMPCRYDQVSPVAYNSLISGNDKPSHCASLFLRAADHNGRRSCISGTIRPDVVAELVQDVDVAFQVWV